MELGAITEAIDVNAQAPLLETACSTLGEVVNSKTTESLPLNGRNVMQLVALTPGINQTRSYREATSASGSIPANEFSANGGRNVSNEPAGAEPQPAVPIVDHPNLGGRSFISPIHSSSRSMSLCI
jgi:hypothetical protein